MSNTFIKFISTLILAFVILINGLGNFIGIGDIIPTEPAETTTAESTTSADDDTTDATDATDVTDEGALTRAEFIELFNAETAKIAESGSYTITRTSNYTSPIDVGGATNVLNGIISAIDESSNLDSVVGYYLGIGTTRANVPSTWVNSNYKIKATTLNEDDIISYSAQNGVYTFTLANAIDPQRTGATSFSKFTNDFVTESEVADSIAELTSVITVKDSTVNYKNIKVEVNVENGKITDMRYSYDFDAEISLKAVVAINGTGSARTTATFSNIAY